MLSQQLFSCRYFVFLDDELDQYSRKPRIAISISAIKHTCLAVAGSSSSAPQAPETRSIRSASTSTPSFSPRISSWTLPYSVHSTQSPTSEATTASQATTPTASASGISISALPATSVCLILPFCILGWARLHHPGSAPEPIDVHRDYRQGRTLVSLLSPPSPLSLQYLAGASVDVFLRSTISLPACGTRHSIKSTPPNLCFTSHGEKHDGRWILYAIP